MGVALPAGLSGRVALIKRSADAVQKGEQQALGRATAGHVVESGAGGEGLLTGRGTPGCGGDAARSIPEQFPVVAGGPVLAAKELCYRLLKVAQGGVADVRAVTQGVSQAGVQYRVHGGRV